MLLKCLFIILILQSSVWSKARNLKNMEELVELEKEALSDAQIRSLAKQIRNQWKEEHPSLAAPETKGLKEDVGIFGSISNFFNPATYADRLTVRFCDQIKDRMGLHKIIGHEGTIFDNADLGKLLSNILQSEGLRSVENLGIDYVCNSVRTAMGLEPFTHTNSAGETESENETDDDEKEKKDDLPEDSEDLDHSSAASGESTELEDSPGKRDLENSVEEKELEENSSDGEDSRTNSEMISPDSESYEEKIAGAQIGGHEFDSDNDPLPLPYKMRF